MKYLIRYAYRGNFGVDEETINVEADSDEEAIEIARDKAERGYLKNSFTILKKEENNDFKRMNELAGIDSNDVREDKRKQLENIILGYCEGIEWVEFNISDLPEMTERILDLFS